MSVDYRVEESSYDTPIDSNKLDVRLSPSDVVNRDIIESIDLDIDQEIGDPRDEQELFYRGLRKLSDSILKNTKEQIIFGIIWDW